VCGWLYLLPASPIMHLITCCFLLRVLCVFVDLCCSFHVCLFRFGVLPCLLLFVCFFVHACLLAFVVCFAYAFGVLSVCLVLRFVVVWLLLCTGVLGRRLPSEPCVCACARAKRDGTMCTHDSKKQELYQY